MTDISPDDAALAVQADDGEKTIGVPGLDQEMPVANPRNKTGAQDKVIERVRAALRPLGYAVGVHGSRERDLDLIAAPWVADAEADERKIAQALSDAGFVVGMGAKAGPHRRLGFALHGASPKAGVKYVDLSVLLPSEALLAEAVERLREIRRIGLHDPARYLTDAVVHQMADLADIDLARVKGDGDGVR